MKEDKRQCFIVGEQLKVANYNTAKFCRKDDSLEMGIWTNIKLKMLFKNFQRTCLQFILPILEYCLAIWNPYYFNAIHQLEMIHRAARFVLNKPWQRNDRDSVSQMLLDLKWPSLQLRRSNSRIS